MINRLRLFEEIPFTEFEDFTGLPISSVEQTIENAVAQKLLITTNNGWKVTPLGHRYLNELLTQFMD